MVGADQPHACGQARRKVRIVGLLGGGVHDEEEHAVLGGVGRARHHQVVEDAAFLVGELGVALAARRQIHDIGGHQRFERARHRLVIGADQERLPHVRDIEQPGVGAHMIVLGDDAVGVLHRHLVAGERHHAAAARDVQRMQRRFQERRGRDGWRIGRRRRGGLGRMRRRRRRNLRVGCLNCVGRFCHNRFRKWTRAGNLPVRAPSVAEPERFRRTACAAYSVGEPLPCGAAAFQSLIPLRSVCLSVSGAVAPSAPDFSGLSRRVRLSCGDGRLTRP